MPTEALSGAVDVYRLLKDKRVPWTDWSISNVLAVELMEHLARVKPKRILEIGSGASTVLLGLHAARHSAQVVSLEHLDRYYGRTRRSLETFDLLDHVDLKLGPLRSRRFPDGEDHLWYDVALEGDFDFVFVDGPPKQNGRQGVLFAIFDHLTPGWEIWLDDGLRPHEQRCMNLWRSHYRFTCSRLDLRSAHLPDSKGVWVMRDAQIPHRRLPAAMPGKLGIGILGNGSPDRLRRTVTALEPYIPSESRVVIMAEDQKATQEVVKSLQVKPQLLPRPGGQPPERLVGQLVAEVLRDRDVRFVLQVDQDWDFKTLDETWLTRALRLLEERVDIEQVRLCHRLDTGQRQGESRRGRRQRAGDQPSEDGYVLEGSVRFALEPSLVTAAALRSRMRRLSSCKLRTAQLSPGAFRRPPEALGSHHSKRSFGRQLALPLTLTSIFLVAVRQWWGSALGRSCRDR